MQERLQPLLTLIDDGISIYRKHFLRFALLAALWIVPMAIAIGLLVGFIERIGDGWAVVVILFMAACSMPLLIYLIGGLSRAAAAALDGKPVLIRTALAIRPRRAAGMGCFTLIYTLIMQIVSSIVSLICICPIWFIGIAFTAILAQAGSSSAFSAIGFVLIGLFFGGVYLFGLLVGGASYSSLIYALQPWIQEERSFGTTLEQSLALVLYRLDFNLAAWFLCGAVLIAGGGSIVLTIGILAPLPLFFLLGDQSPIALAIAASAWLIALVLLVPPLPIWMLLLYRRHTRNRAAADLVARVDAWAARG
ncbi:MAG TPA: hypothetical protein PKA05_03435 [Roseiflexaceae bacterium]|nr:hypothetical protein [Roseiflexaceae bacterium]